MTSLEQTREAWEKHAHAYDEFLTATDAQAAREALGLADVGPGTRLLDIAAGGGAVSLPAAEMGAAVLAVDYSEAMVELLRSKAERAGLSDLVAQVMDGMSLALEDESFDVACSELGIMLFPDRKKGLSEMARVVKKGGLGVMVTLGPPQRVEAIGLFVRALAEGIPGFAPPAQSPLFCLQDLNVLRAEMEEAGFASVRTSTFTATMAVESGDGLWTSLVAGAPAVAGILQSVPEEGQRAARAVLNDLISARAADGGPVQIDMEYNIGIGTK